MLRFLVAVNRYPLKYLYADLNCVFSADLANQGFVSGQTQDLRIDLSVPGQILPITALFLGRLRTLG